MKHSFMGQIESVDASRSRISIDLMFLTPEQLFDLEKAFENDLNVTVTIKFPSKDKKTFKQQKKWYVTLREILKANNIFITAERMSMLDEALRRSCFPCKFVNFEDTKIPYVPNMRELTMDEMSDAIQKLLERYDYILNNLKFSETGIDIEGM